MHQILPPVRVLATALLAIVTFPAARGQTTLTATPSTTEGPYYTMSSANNADKSHFTGEGIDNDLTRITSSSTQCNGTLFLLSGTLYNTSGVAIPGATIELWEADNGGIYWYTSSSSTTNAYASRDKNFQGYGTCTTASDGSWSFRTIRPGLYVGRIRHFHFKVRINGTEYLTSQFMFAEDSASYASDNVAGPLVSAGTMSLVTLSPTSGTDSSGNSALIASKDIVISYNVTVTAPAITTQPSSVSVAAGSTASFSVVASGTSLTYQWYKDGSAISGATSAAYSISSVTASSAGSYHVVVSNSAGTATSSSATLTVISGTIPTIATQPLPAAIASGESVTFSVAASSTTALGYQWYQDDTAISGATSSSLAISDATSGDAGTYHVVVTNSSGSVESDAVRLFVTTATSSGHRLANLSARALVPGADTPLIAGFVVEGSDGKRLLVRAIGPTLETFGVADVVEDPKLEVFDSTGASTTSNDNWSSSLSDLFTELGAYSLPENSKDAALVVDLPAGTGTAHVTSSSAGVALVEAYDTDTTTTARLVNLSARAQVGTGASVLIAGFVIDGSGGKRILVRGVGPGLASYSVADYLADPQIHVYLSDGTLIAASDDWSGDLASTFTSLGAFSLSSGSKDAAILVTLPAGSAYTAVVSGVGSTTGQALVELYEVP